MQISSALISHTLAPNPQVGNTASAQQKEEQGVGPVEPRAKQHELEQQQQELLELSARDREVRTHEQAHASVGGQYAGSPTYDFKRGPDGRNYAVSGEVPIDVSAIANDPKATLAKMEQVQRAALAPIEPSGADRRIAAEAANKAAQARSEIIQQRREQESGAAQVNADSKRSEASDQESRSPEAGHSARSLLQTYQRMTGQEPKVQGLHFKV